MKGRTLYDKIWDQHVVYKEADGPTILYVDLHLLHEVSSPQAFDGLRKAGRHVRRPDLSVATVDHAIPTKDRDLPFRDQLSAHMVNVLRENCEKFDIKLYDLGSVNQGIVHVIAPEMGLSLPGQTIVCGDSHTSTHGAFGTLAFGIGTSEVETVLATQSIKQFKTKTLSITIDGQLGLGVTAKDLILYIIGKFGTKFATGYTVEYRGECVKNLTMEERMTLCNMSIEMGARAGMIAPDQTTFEYLKGRKFSPKGEEWEKAVSEWEKLETDPDAIFDLELEVDANKIAPQVTWGTNPAQVISVNDLVPDPMNFDKVGEREEVESALKYMDLKSGQSLKDVQLDNVFIGSCTNSRIEDLRDVAKIIKGHKVKDTVHAIVVPGSQSVKKMAEKEGISDILIEAGFEWRDSGCSMCLGMNEDYVLPGKRCASTSNRNFEGRQGRDARTHLVSPIMAAIASIKGHFVDIREWKEKGMSNE